LNEREEHAAKAARLKAQARKLRLDFARADLDTAFTFLGLARFEFQKGATDDAARLLGKAQRAADTIADIIAVLPESDADGLREKLSALLNAIGETKKNGLSGGSSAPPWR
jgi:hypothetical protein